MITPDLQRPRRQIRDLSLDEAGAQARKARRLLTWPVNAPGMPPPGPDFLRHALALGDRDTLFEKRRGVVTYRAGRILQGLYDRALRRLWFPVPVEMQPGRIEQIQFLPGHLWGGDAAAMVDAFLASDNAGMAEEYGPRPADIMVVGKMPWKDEQACGRNLAGASGEVLKHYCERRHFKNLDRWYVTNLVKFIPPGTSTTLKAGWIADCLPLLHMELRLVQPRYLLCLGADAAKAVLGKQASVSGMDGRVERLRIPVYREGEPEAYHEMQVMVVIHPAEVARAQSTDKGRSLERGLGRFFLLTKGKRFDQAEDDIDHRVCRNLEEAEAWAEEAIYELRQQPQRTRLMAWDAEWQGTRPMNPGSYLRTVQCSWKEKSAICFVMSDTQGQPAFLDNAGRPAMKRLWAVLDRVMKESRARAVGHFFMTDMEQLLTRGFDPTRYCPVPLFDKNGKKAWERFRDAEGWFDTAMMCHAVEEAAGLGLEALTSRYTMAPRYDRPLDEAKKRLAAAKGIKVSKLNGYGELADADLVPYANYDADVERRIAISLMDYLDCDYEGNSCWEPCWESMIAQPVIIDMRLNGVMRDQPRIDALTLAFSNARDEMEEQIKAEYRWPDLNLRSTNQVRELLYGTQNNGTFDKFGQRVRQRPPGAVSLNLEPILDTTKPPRVWRDLVEKRLDRTATPTTNKLVLDLHVQDLPDELSQKVARIRDYRYLDQALKSTLRLPTLDDEGEWMEDDQGNWIYESGLASHVDADGRIRTWFNSTAETGRWKSSKPNLQNFSKSRDEDYARLLGEHYVHKMRSVLKASPGMVLVEFDYKGAELFVMAVMAGDKAMIDHSMRSNLDDSGYDALGNKAPGGKFPHPNYYDIHSNVAVLAFHLRVPLLLDKKSGKPVHELLNCRVGDPVPATKYALGLCGMSRYRNLAKNVIFGIAYGRGARAVALQANASRKRGDPAIREEEAQRVIDTIFAMYPGLTPFYEEARVAAIEHGFLCHCYGRLRRFPAVRDYQLEGEIERQARNFPIQGPVASAVNRGLAYMRHTINSLGLRKDVRLLLQLHDAGVLECWPGLVDWVKTELVPTCMCKMVPIYPTRLDGTPTGTGPYYFGVDFAVEEHWGEKISPARAAELGLSV